MGADRRAQKIIVNLREKEEDFTQMDADKRTQMEVENQRKSARKKKILL